MYRKWITAIITMFMLSVPVAVQERGGEDEFGPYEPVPAWPQHLPGHEGWVFGETSGIFAESPDRIIVLQRGELPLPAGRKPGPDAIAAQPGMRAPQGTNRFEHCVYIVDRTGKVVDSWTQWDQMFAGGRGPHKVFMNPYDPERHVWIVDDMLHQVFKFTNDGKKIVLTLGERLVRGEDDKHFGRPTDMAFLPDGTFFVADGYANTRVVKFDKNGKYLLTWGKPGTGPGEFNTPHGLAIDKNRRVYVADRANKRIQIFDENGKYLDAIPNIPSAWHIFISPDQYLWVADGETNKFVKYDLNGRFLYSWGTYGQKRGYMSGVHQFSVDSEGNLYLADILNTRAQKMRPKAGADPAKLMRAVPLSPVGR